MKKIIDKTPWGVLMGVCGVIVFYSIVGTVAANIIVNAVTSIVEGAAGLFGTWYQQLLFAFDIIFGLGFIGSLVMYVLKKTKKVNKEEGQE